MSSPCTVCGHTKVCYWWKNVLGPQGPVTDKVNFLAIRESGYQVHFSLKVWARNIRDIAFGHCSCQFVCSTVPYSSVLNTVLVGQFTHGPLSLRQTFQHDGAPAHNGKVRQATKIVFPVTATTSAWVDHLMIWVFWRWPVCRNTNISWYEVCFAIF